MRKSSTSRFAHPLLGGTSIQTEKCCSLTVPRNGFQFHRHNNWRQCDGERPCGRCKSLGFDSVCTEGGDASQERNSCPQSNSTCEKAFQDSLCAYSPQCPGPSSCSTQKDLHKAQFPATVTKPKCFLKNHVCGLITHQSIPIRF